MAKLDIGSINYIVTGNDQKILNIDIMSGGANINMSFFTDTEVGVDLSNTFKFNGDVGAKYPNPNQYGCLLMESNNSVGTDGKYTLRALYDSKDVAFKSAVAKNISRNVPDDDSSIDNDIDIYFPHLKSEPLGFVQLQQYSYGITDDTRIAPVMLGTNLKDQRNSVATNKSAYTTKPTWRNNLNPYDRFGSTSEDPGTVVNTIPTYLYTSLNRLQAIVRSAIDAKFAPMLSVEELSSEALSAKSAELSLYDPISYYSFKTFAANYLSDNNALTSFFKPVYNFQNIEHNYIFEVPMSDNTGNFSNAYSKAQIKADIVMAKNVYDDIYDTNVEKIGKFDRIREYVGIGACGGKVFLKYFDDRRYSAGDSFVDDRDYIQANGDIKDVPTENVSPTAKRKDYMKIECIKSINRFISSAMHKANLYSAKVCGLNDLLKAKNYNEEIRARIRQDIDNSIRRIVKNFAPAHTEYFGVVDWPDEPYEDFSSKQRC